MSTIVRGPDGLIKLYTKGADSVIYERLAADQQFGESTLVHLEVRNRACLADRRITRRKVSGRYVWRIETFRKQNTPNGRKCTTMRRRKCQAGPRLLTM